MLSDCGACDWEDSKADEGGKTADRVGWRQPYMNEKRKILGDHKRVGKRLIPPLMQLPNVAAVSFRDERLPDVVWLSAMLLRSRPRDAVNAFIDFVKLCTDVVKRGEVGSLAYLGNFALLTEEEKLEIRRRAVERGLADELCYRLDHQRSLLDDYPLEFLYGDLVKSPTERGIARLREDVEEMLDRYSDHATKVQTTAVVAQLALGKLQLTRDIKVPDFNAIFEAPESPEARRVASFSRSAINAGIGLSTEGADSDWARRFWKQAFRMSTCEDV